MSRLHRALHTLASRGAPRGASQIFSAVFESMGSAASEPMVRIEKGDEIMASTIVQRRTRPGWIAFVVAFGAALALGLAMTLVVRPLGTGGSQDFASDGEIPNTAVPGPTLEPIDGPPMTVPANAELSFYAYLPDLHLAWRATEDSATEICWKTVTEEGCQTDLFYAPETVVVPNGGQVIILTRPAIGGEAPSGLVIEFSNGQSIRQSLTTRGGIAIAYARVELPQGLGVVSATASP